MRYSEQYKSTRLLTYIVFFCLATAETGDEESVTRAKYFIRDEFLVSTALILI